MSVKVSAKRGQDANQIYFGQDCYGKKHFDCVGFVAYVLTKQMGSRVHPGQTETSNQRASWVRALGSTPTGMNEAHPPCQPGDIFLSAAHVAMVVEVSGGEIKLVHAYGEQWGVVGNVFHRTDRTWRNAFTVINLGRAYLGA